MWSGSGGRTGIGPPRSRKVFFESQRYKGPQQPVRFCSTSAKDLERALSISLASRVASRARGSPMPPSLASSPTLAKRPATVGVRGSAGASVRSPAASPPARFVDGKWTAPRAKRPTAAPLLHSLRGRRSQATGGMAIEYRPAGRMAS